MTSSNQMLDNKAHFSGVDIATQPIDTESLSTASDGAALEGNAASKVQLDSDPSSESCKAPVLRAVKLPYRATHQVELLHLHAEIEALLQQVRTLKQQRLANPVSLNEAQMDLSNRDRPLLALR